MILSLLSLPFVGGIHSYLRLCCKRCIGVLLLPTMEWRSRTLMVVYLAGIMEKADESVLPGVYHEIETAMSASPTALGTLTLLRCIVQILFSPLAAYLSLRYHRASVIAAGALLWALATLGVGLSTTFFQVALFRAFNGVGLAIVIPAIQSMVADTAEEGSRGLAFGWLTFNSGIGYMIGNVCSVLLAGTTVFGIPGWRVSFFLVAIISVGVGALVYKYAVDPRFFGPNAFAMKERNSSTSAMVLKETVVDVKRVIKLPTFIVIVVQGVSGNFPWVAFSFLSMWLELTGFSHNVTAMIMASFTISTSIGAVFGGHLGDIAAAYLPNSGRIIVAQFSSSIGVPLAAVLFLGLPVNPTTAWSHGSLFFIMGLLISWCSSGTNNPIFAEVVPEKSRTTIYAMDRSFESLLAAFAPPIVGILAQNVFGYVPPTRNVSHAKEMMTDRNNATALARAIYTMTGIPFTICCLLYTLLYKTYPKDRDKAQVEAMTKSELGELAPTVEYTKVKGDDSFL